MSASIMGGSSHSGPGLVGMQDMKNFIDEYHIVLDDDVGSGENDVFLNADLVSQPLIKLVDGKLLVMDAGKTLLSSAISEGEDVYCTAYVGKARSGKSTLASREAGKVDRHIPIPPPNTEFNSIL